jgi:Domain of Kin17 curved DNA-binding protein
MGVSSNPNKKIEEFSREFKNDFIRLLKTSHGTKSVQINHFYQKYIAHKEHVHERYEVAEFDGICKVLRRRGYW